MQPEIILKSDVLDILFENRNKEYGAYTLRREYDVRLSKAMLITFGFAALFLLLSFGFKVKDKSIRAANIPGIFTLKPLPKPLAKKPATPKKHAVTAPKKTAQNILTAAILAKPTIVKDAFADRNIIKTADVLKQNISDNKTNGSDNINPQNIVMDNGDGNGKGNQPGNTTESIDDSKPITNPDVFPDFPGGKEAFSNFLKKNLVAPGELNEEMISVKVRFVVNADGSISGFDVIQSGGDDFDKEVLRVLKKMPHWIPGKSNGHNVSVYYEVLVKFVVDSN